MMQSILVCVLSTKLPGKVSHVRNASGRPRPFCSTTPPQGSTTVRALFQTAVQPTALRAHGRRLLLLRPRRIGSGTERQRTPPCIRDQFAAGLIVLHRGKVVLEKYARGYDAGGRWLSQSMAKSVTSILVGAAIHDHAIASLDDPVIKYLPEMKGSAYDGVNLRQVLTMTSGVKWNEDYTDKDSDVAKYGRQLPENGIDPIVVYMRRLPREATPGEKWVYKTGETHLIGSDSHTRAIGKPLADYLSEKDLATLRNGARCSVANKPARRGMERVLYGGELAGLRPIRSVRSRRRQGAGQASRQCKIPRRCDAVGNPGEGERDSGMIPNSVPG